MFRLAFLFFAFGVAACSGPGVVVSPSNERPMRIVSLDFCADQYVLKLADPAQVLAISPGGVKGFSYMRDAAVGVPTVRPVAEDVLILKPDLVVRSYGGGPNAAAFFEQAGVPVLQVGWASNIDGEGVGAIPNLIQHMADGLGHPERGRVMVSEFRARLDAISSQNNGQSALYMTPAGVTTGPGSLIHEVIDAAGLANFQENPGWRSLPLERLAYEQPDLIAAAYFETQTNHPHGWSPTRHPVAKQQLTEQDVIQLQGAWTACGGWFILHAIETLAAGADQ